MLFAYEIGDPKLNIACELQVKCKVHQVNSEKLCNEMNKLCPHLSWNKIPKNGKQNIIQLG